jgi:transcriptional regulator with XRE-family HTH domain
MRPEMSAGRLVRYTRRRARLTQRALAERAGVPQSAIARIERNAVSPRIDTVTDLLAAAGFSLEVGPRLGAGVDRSLVRANLQRSPEERIRGAAVAGRNLGSWLEAARGQPSR